MNGTLSYSVVLRGRGMEGVSFRTLRYGARCRTGNEQMSDTLMRIDELRLQCARAYAHVNMRQMLLPFVAWNTPHSGAFTKQCTQAMQHAQCTLELRRGAAAALTIACGDDTHQVRSMPKQHGHATASMCQRFVLLSSAGHCAPTVLEPAEEHPKYRD